MQQPEAQMPPIDLKNTTEVKNFDGGVLFNQGLLMRKVSKFITGTNEDALLPIPVFYCVESKKILKDSIPQELREEYKDYTL